MIKNPPMPTSATGAWPEPGGWTYDAYRQLPDDEQRYEVIEGNLYVMAPPAILHQIVIANLVKRLGAHVDQHDLGLLLVSPVEVILSQIATPVQPDLIFIRREQLHIAGKQRVEGSPDLAAEVLSPSSIRHDRLTKFDAYERAGVGEYWIVNPKGETVEVYALEGNEYGLIGEFRAAEPLVSSLFGTLPFNAGDLFKR
jgi:Uma2 family endonuclease